MDKEKAIQIVKEYKDLAADICPLKPNTCSKGNHTEDNDIVVVVECTSDDNLWRYSFTVETET